jgi:hypothetical protein
MHGPKLGAGILNMLKLLRRNRRLARNPAFRNPVCWRVSKMTALPFEN